MLRSTTDDIPSIFSVSICDNSTLYIGQSVDHVKGIRQFCRSIMALAAMLHAI
jgi:hypothetical protein